MPPAAALLFCLALAACGDVPQVNAPTPPAGPEPTIAPIDALVSLAPPPGSMQPADPDGLVPRADALRARAEALRVPVADPATRAPIATP
ncbi:MAG: hypothetical protein WAK98_08430 [Gemmobacter sp.]